MRIHIAFWFVLALLANANGVLRVLLLEPRVDELAAHQLSTLSLAGLVTVAVFWLARRVPLERPSQARAVGALWLVLTVAFEFGFGRWVAGHPWSRLLRDYDLSAGRLWPCFLVWLAILPALARRWWHGAPR